MVTPRQARLLAGYATMSDMAAAMDMPVSTYISKETGLTAFTIKEGFRLAELCGFGFMDIDFLWADRPEKRNGKGESAAADREADLNEQESAIEYITDESNGT